MVFSFDMFSLVFFIICLSFASMICDNFILVFLCIIFMEKVSDSPVILRGMDMKNLMLAGCLFAAPVSAGEPCAKPECVKGYIEETVVVKRPVWIKRTPVIETREKQITVKESVVVGYKEEVVEAAPVRAKKRLFGGLFKKCSSCD